MKKIFAILLAGILVFCTGCGQITQDIISDVAKAAASELAPVIESYADNMQDVISQTDDDETASQTITESVYSDGISEDGTYSSKNDVALYILTFGHLPSNFITKKEAKSLGWEGGSLEPYAPGKCIGGDHFGNYEGILPEVEGRSYTECDIDTLGANSRGAKRIVFSNDGLIYYTNDHYESFTLLYGEE